MELKNKRDIIHDVKDCKDKEEVYIYESCKKVSAIYKELLNELLNDDSMDNAATLNVMTSFIITNFNRETLYLLNVYIPIEDHEEFVNLIVEDLKKQLMESIKLFVK